MRLKLEKLLTFTFMALLSSALSQTRAAELPLVRIAYGAFSEKVAVMWVGAEQGLFRKHGVHVEVITSAADHRHSLR